MRHDATTNNSFVPPQNYRFDEPTPRKNVLILIHAIAHLTHRNTIVLCQRQPRIHMSLLNHRNCLRILKVGLILLTPTTRTPISIALLHIGEACIRYRRVAVVQCKHRWMRLGQCIKTELTRSQAPPGLLVDPVHAEDAESVLHSKVTRLEIRRYTPVSLEECEDISFFHDLVYVHSEIDKREAKDGVFSGFGVDEVGSAGVLVDFAFEGVVG